MVRALIILAWSMTAVLQAGQVRLVKSPPGCEDMAHDEVRGRLIISCDDRRNPYGQGGLYTLYPREGVVRPLPVFRNVVKNLRPHGISLLRARGLTFLYVINHHGRQTEVLVFQVSPRSLRYLRTLGPTGTELFATPNDLVALPSGEVFMTNPSSLGKSLLYYSPTTKAWKVAARGMLYPNGVHAQGQRIFVNNSSAGATIVYQHLGEGRLSGGRDLVTDQGAVDNFSENRRGDLLYAGAATLLGFTRYFLDPDFNPAGRVYRLRGGRQQVLQDTAWRGWVRAPSVAVEVGDSLIIGQPFDAHLALIKNPSWR